MSRWSVLDDPARLVECRRRIAEGCTLRDIASDMMTSKGVVAGFVYRNITKPRPRHQRFLWTPPMLARLISLVEEGKSAAYIVQVMELPNIQCVHSALKRTTIRFRANASKDSRAALQPRIQKGMGPPKVSARPVTMTGDRLVENPKRFVDRRIGFECAWIVGDAKEPDAQCCGAPTDYDKSWCKAHAAIVFGRAA